MTTTSTSTSTTTTLSEPTIIDGVTYQPNGQTIGGGGSDDGGAWRSRDGFMIFSPPGKQLGDTFQRRDVSFVATEVKTYTTKRIVRFSTKVVTKPDEE